MPESQLIQLASQSAFSFTGTVRHVGASNLAGLAANERTAIVHVDAVLHAASALQRLSGSDIVVQLAPGEAIIRPGQSVVLFTDPLAFGERVAVREVARLPVSAVEPHIAAATAAGVSPQLSISQQVQAATIRVHANEAVAIVVGTVLRLEKAGPTRFAEHDPDYWRATLQIDHVERGDVPWGEVTVLYANSQDVRYRQAPKPRASQRGVWLLHRTEAAQRDLASFLIIHPEDYQPIETLELIRTGGTKP
jgi:hypothetical protein